MTTQQTKVDADVAFLLAAADHFDRLPTGGEDRAHWANVSNAENCRRIADRLAQPEGPTPSPELTARMVALVREAADMPIPTNGFYVDRYSTLRGIARAIAAEFEPVDPDLAFARELFDIAYPDGIIAWDVPEVRQGWIRAAKHVRALAEAGK